MNIILDEAINNIFFTNQIKAVKWMLKRAYLCLMLFSETKRRWKLELYTDWNVSQT